VLDLLLVAFPGSAHGSLGTPTQTDQNLPHVSFVIAHAKLLLDQVRHARAGPQWGFIAQSFGTLQQQGVQPLQVLPAQARLATRPPRLPQPRLALSAILLHPTGYGLTNHLDLASNAGLILASFVQANGLETAFLQGVKIASYTGRVSHVCLDAATSEKVSLYYAGVNKLEKFQAGESLARPPLVAQAALPAAILWVQEVWTLNVRMTGVCSSRGDSTSLTLGYTSW